MKSVRAWITAKHNAGMAPWLVFGAFALAVFWLRSPAPWLQAWPDAWVVPFIPVMNVGADWFIEHFRWLFRAVSWAFNWPMQGVNAALQWAPWPAVIAVFTVIAHRAEGARLAAFTAGALGYMAVTGYWSESMSTLSLVAVSVPLSVAAGFTLGVMGFRSARVNRVMQPVLDIMQTVPAFAYLIPILLLFGFGPVVGLIASAVYAAPPMVRNTILGLQRVPADVTESAVMSGCTLRQKFWQAEVPSALPQIMIGVNQTTMAALSMVIIAAIIGGFADIGWEVLTTMRKAQFGQSLLAGLVIALMAMVLDRISGGFARGRSAPSEPAPPPGTPFWVRWPHMTAALAAFVFFTAAAPFAPALAVYPEAWVFYPAEALNSGVKYIVANYHQEMTALKKAALFYVMLPFRIGLEQTISPFSWGFEFTAPMKAGYAAGAVIFTVLAWRWRGWRAGAAAGMFGALLYYGTGGAPWPVFIAAVTLLAWQAGGLKTAAFAGLSMLFMLVNGVWPQAMLSVYLCGVAVIICVILGGALGVWAAHNNTVSGILRPVNDTLQTMPQFVLLIPVLMLFKVGEFTALLAVIAYAIVPMIRYVEHGLRAAPAEIIEAARQMGCTPFQMLFEVKMPLAWPVITLGLNQTIMYGLAMLAIAALVGTQGLGQAVYIALGKANIGSGIVAGLSMALVAMTADRILQSFSKRRQEALGLEAVI
ncbi:MAG: ABC transporter permease [Rhodospirillales bacterium]